MLRTGLERSAQKLLVQALVTYEARAKLLDWREDEPDLPTRHEGRKLAHNA